MAEPEVENVAAAMGVSSPAADPLTVQQLDLLRRMSELDPSPCVWGGYAEDALLAGTVTRAHLDVDWLLPRRELELRLEQARELGFTDFETWGEAAPGEPFYLFGSNGELNIDLAVSDEADGRQLARIWKIAFEIDGVEAPAGYQFALPDDTYTYPPAMLEGIRVHVASPLALYQIRAGIAARGSFGPLSPSQQASLQKLRETFFPHRTEAQLTPQAEPLEVH
jgi:hypothetical protein